MSDQNGLQKATRRKKRRASPLWSLVLLLGAWWLYGNRTDANFALTVWPAWIALLAGALLALPAKGRTLLVAAWLAFAVVFVDEAKSLPRSLLPDPPHRLRVVTLNCAGGTVAAALEVERFKPDLVLLEESPSRREVADLAHRFFGSEGDFVTGPDASILARGTLIEQQIPSGTADFVAADWRTPDGKRLNVVSLRLTPPCMRIDLYNPAAWREFSTNRVSRRQEVDEIATKLRRMGFAPALIGGDFNTPPDPEVLRTLTGSLKDTFAEVGVGLGATCVNPRPCLVRIDQLWHGPSIVGKRARVVPTQNSDHRMLVADYDWN